MGTKMLILTYNDLLKSNEDLTKKQLVELLRLMEVINYNRVVDYLNMIFTYRGDNYILYSKRESMAIMDMTYNRKMPVDSLIRYLKTVIGNNPIIDMTIEEMSLFIDEPQRIKEYVDVMVEVGLIKYNGIILSMGKDC